MSSQTLPETGPTPRPAEIAPSEVAIDEFRWPRLIGLVGAMLSGIALAIIALNQIYAGAVYIGKGWGFVGLVIGVPLALYHALRDPDYEVRRAYGLIGYLLLGLIVVLTLIRTTNFLAYGWACALIGLSFLLCFSKHETSLSLRRVILITLGGLGALMALGGFVGGIVLDNFLATYGSVLTLLGLIYLAAFVSQSNRMTDTAHWTGLAIGALSVLIFIFAIGRSAAPSFVKMTPFLTPNGLLLIFLSGIYGMTSLAIVSDSKLVVQARRELTTFFYSPVAYIVMLAMALLGFVAFWFFVSLVAEVGQVGEPIVRHYFSMLPPIVVMFVVPAITMRLFSEERRTGTYEVLMCAPVKESTVVLSKFFACLIFFMLLWIIWALYLLALWVEGGNEFDYRPLLSFALALGVSGAGFIAMGLFFSSLSKNQVIAAVLTFIGMVFIFLLGWLGQVERFEAVSPMWRAVFRNISYSGLWESSLMGRVQVRQLILQGSFAFFWLFLTVKVLEARRWS